MSDDGLTLAEEPNRNVWFISQRGKGFTCYADLALKTPQGWPVAAPGEGLIAARHVLKHKGKLWEYLLDEMEKMYLLQEERETLGRDACLSREHRDAEARHDNQVRRCASLRDAIAILDHGVLDENTKALTEAQANIRYAQSVGD